MFFLQCRYGWQHRELTHIHGFIWLADAPNMDILYWEDIIAVEVANFFLDTYVTAWNPCDTQFSTYGLHHYTTNDPCNLASPSIFASNYSADYEELVNFVQSTPNVQSQLSFARKEHLFNVAMVFHMSCKLLLHY